MKKHPSGSVRAGTPDTRAGVRLMIRPEPTDPKRAQVVGELTGEAIQILLAAVAGGARVLDLSEVDQADDRAVRALARLSPEPCAFVGVPRWLELWIARARGVEGVREVVAVPPRKSRER